MYYTLNDNKKRNIKNDLNKIDSLFIFFYIKNQSHRVHNDYRNVL